MNNTKFKKEDIIKKPTFFINNINTNSEYLNESIHSKNLYDGVLTLMNADNHSKLIEFLELAKSSLETDIRKIFEHMCLCSNMAEYFFENKSTIRTLILKDILDDITLDNIPELKNNLEKIDTSYFYSEELLIDLYKINKSLGEIFNKNTEKLLCLEKMISNISEAIEDPDYLESDEEMSDYFLKTYKRLDYDRLNDISSKKQTCSPKDVFEISDILLLENKYNKNELEPRYIGEKIYYGNFFNLVKIYSAYKKFLEGMNNDER